ncbi:hypothetical protein BKA70DRAFT_388688 [Coprinopsis sp. MPI-PUGE-AT-0042]|nr:hypothetical protein BKA70DRAFT_388688 [Coprinopsis sp. MPI-PUGE-AT-0042]
MAPTLQTPPQSHYSSVKGGAVPPAIPSIRLISATPSTNGHDDSMTLASPPPPLPAMPWESTYPSANAEPAPVQGSKTLRSVRSVLKPKSSGKENRTVVPKKSKLGLLGGLAGNKDEKKAKDLSDVVRRMGISSASVSVNGAVVNQGSRSKTPSVASKDSQTLSLFRSSSNTSKEEKRASKTLKAQEKEAIKQNTLGKAGSVKLKGGFEIFVDPSYEDEEIGEILVVRKKKSRAGLDGVFGMDAGVKTGKSGTFGEITNGSARMRSESQGSVRGRTESAKYDKQDGGLLKPKENDKKWWNLSIGGSRKDSTDERKEENVQDSLPMRSQTPDPFKPSSSEKESKAGRGRFNSLDAGVLLGLSSKKSNGDLDRAASPVPPPQRKGSMPMPAIIVAEPSPAECDFKATKYESMAPPPPMARSTSLPLGHGALLAYSAKCRRLPPPPSLHRLLSTVVSLPQSRSIRWEARTTRRYEECQVFR